MTVIDVSPVKYTPTSRSRKKAGIKEEKGKSRESWRLKRMKEGERKENCSPEGRAKRKGNSQERG